MTSIPAERPWSNPIRHVLGETYIENMINRDADAGQLMTTCWCEAEVHPVPIEHVRRGLTISCGRLKCIYWLNPEGLHKHMIELQIRERKRSHKKRKSSS